MSVAIPPGYRKLEVGEVIKDGDKLWSLTDEWLDGHTIEGIHVLPDELWIRPIGPQTRKLTPDQVNLLRSAKQWVNLRKI